MAREAKAKAQREARIQREVDEHVLHMLYSGVDLGVAQKKSGTAQTSRPQTAQTRPSASNGHSVQEMVDNFLLAVDISNL